MYPFVNCEDSFSSSCESDRNCCIEERYIIGPCGPIGPRGPQGPQGPRGIQGLSGPEGIAGIRGPQGETGPQGEVGLQGIAGPTGQTGAIGPIGESGPQGPQGLQGIQGYAGPQGEPGSDAVPAFFVIGSAYATNSQLLSDGCSVNFDQYILPYGTHLNLNHDGLCVDKDGTYLINFGICLEGEVCVDDYIELLINNETCVLGSKTAILGSCLNTTGIVLTTLQANDCISIVIKSSCELSLAGVCGSNQAHLIIQQINA